jgi:hypothetical protein
MFKHDDATRTSVCVDIGDEIEWVLVVETKTSALATSARLQR